MHFIETPVPGLLLVELERKIDERGFFARLWCREELAGQGLDPNLAQCSISYNHRMGTVRGMHWQDEPHAEVKLVRCIRGAICDVAIDLRRGSPTFGRWFAAELSASSRTMLYIPAGCAHGFQTLTDDSEILYLISAPRQAQSARGLRWNDPSFRIEWPLAVTAISERDQTWPLWREET